MKHSVHNMGLVTRLQFVEFYCTVHSLRLKALFVHCTAVFFLIKELIFGGICVIIAKNALFVQSSRLDTKCESPLCLQVFLEYF